MNGGVSVLMVVWNGARFIGAALASAVAQTRPADEILVVDDGSSDDSAAIALATPGVRVVRQAHAGVAAARNRAIAEAKGELLAWLDADDAWTPDKLAVQVAYMEAHPEVGMSFTHQRLSFEPGVARPYWVKPEQVGAESPLIGTGSMVVRAALFAALGGFDPARRSGEDSDWIYRARDAGVQLAMVPQALLLRRVHAHNLSTLAPIGRAEVLSLLRASIARKRSRVER